MKLFINEKIILEHLEIADSFVSRFFGLMGRKSLPKNEGLVITPCKMVHNCFMRFSIDLIFVDKENKIVGLVNGLSTWRLSPFFKNADFVIECNDGIINSNNIKIGSMVEITP